MKRHSLFASRLGVALGIGSIGAACGGKVIFDTASGSGTTGTGGTGSTGVSSGNVTASVTGATTGSGCAPMPKPGETVANVCYSAGICPSESDPTLKVLLAKVLNAGVNNCTSLKVVDAVVCESGGAGNCCYTVLTSPGCLEGRPFYVDGEARTADGARRDDWLSASSAVCVDALDTATRAALAREWTNDALAEHASIASFARAVLELLAVGAPADLVREAQAAMADEIRHAQLSFALASAYAGQPVGPSALSLGDANPCGTLAEVAAATVRDGCVNETVSALVAMEAREGATDHSVREALDEIASDEARHAELAWKTVDWALAVGGRDVHAAVARAFEDATRLPVAAWTGASSALRPHGQLADWEKAAIHRDALEQIIRPTALALLAKHAVRVPKQETIPRELV